MTESESGSRDVILDVIGREHQALTAAGQQIHTTLIWQFILACATLALRFGWVTIGSQLSLGGLTVSIPQPSLVLVLSAVVMVLFWRVASLTLYGYHLRKIIASRYDALGFTAHTDPSGFRGFLYPDVLTVLDALPSRLLSYVKQLIQERPLKRTLWRLSAAACWLLAMLVVLLLIALLWVMPFVVDCLVGQYAWQQHVHPVVVIAYSLALGLIYVASVWMLMLTFDRRETAEMFNGILASLLENAKYEQAGKRAYEVDKESDALPSVPAPPPPAG
jgi:hypothetical protein